jgi:hypothetical protein
MKEMLEKCAPSAAACICDLLLLPSAACVRVFCSCKLGDECASWELTEMVQNYEAPFNAIFLKPNL